MEEAEALAAMLSIALILAAEFSAMGVVMTILPRALRLPVVYEIFMLAGILLVIIGIAKLALTAIRTLDFRGPPADNAM